MSIFFEAGTDDLWNPSNNVGRLFISQARLFENLLGQSSGAGEVATLSRSTPTVHPILGDRRWLTLPEEPREKRSLCPRRSTSTPIVG